MLKFLIVLFTITSISGSWCDGELVFTGDDVVCEEAK